MQKHQPILYTLKERLFYLLGTEEIEPFSESVGKDLTVLINPFSSFNDIEIDLPTNKYYGEVINYLRTGNTMGIILSNDNLDRLIIETMIGLPKKSRIFMQTGNEAHDGFCYYQDTGMDRHNNELMKMVNQIKPNRIYVGGSYLAETEDELNKWDLEEFPFEYSADSGCFVGPIYLMFRDKYPTMIAKNLTKRN